MLKGGEGGEGREERRVDFVPLWGELRVLEGGAERLERREGEEELVQPCKKGRDDAGTLFAVPDPEAR